MKNQRNELGFQLIIRPSVTTSQLGGLYSSTERYTKTAQGFSGQNVDIFFKPRGFVEGLNLIAHCSLPVSNDVHQHELQPA